MKKLFSKMDIPLLIMTIIFCLFGLLMIFSSSSVSSVIRYDVPPYYFFLKQTIIIIAVLIICFTLILKVPTRNYNSVIWIAVLLLIFSLAFLFVKGKITNDVVSWYKVGPISIQPSEFAKPVMIIFLACFYDKFLKRKHKNIYAGVFPLLIAVVVVGLIIMQPDLGSAVILSGIIFLTFISIPIEKNNIFKIVRVVGIALVIGVIALLYSGQDILNSSQLKRLQFQNPCSRYSTQKYLYLPESHTDFIFPIIVEELGLIVGIAVIFGYIYMLYRILRIAKKSETLRCSILAYGTFWYLALHILINLLGILALIPLTGVPLPFLSYGGSFIINVLTMIFIVERVNIENNINKTNREIRSL